MGRFSLPVFVAVRNNVSTPVRTCSVIDVKRFIVAYVIFLINTAYFNVFDFANVFYLYNTLETKT